MISKNAIRLVAIVLLGSVPACHTYYPTSPDQPKDWRAEPQACARFWDKNFAAAIQGGTRNAEFLYTAIAESKLVPPGRDPGNYSQRQKDFDLLALMRLSINKFVPQNGGEVGLEPLWGGVEFQYGTGYDAKIRDPHSTQINALRRVKEYLGYVNHNFRFGQGICAKRTGLSESTDEWSAACRQILVNDGVLPSTEDFVSTIPENTHACGYKG